MVDFTSILILAQFIPIYINSSVLKLAFEVLLAIYVYLIGGKNLFFVLTRSPFTWDLAGKAIQIGLMEEIIEAAFIENNPHQKASDKTSNLPCAATYDYADSMIANPVTTPSKGDYKFRKKHKKA